MADLFPQAMHKVVLKVGEYRGADFDNLLAAVARHNLGIEKGHKIKDETVLTLLQLPLIEVGNAVKAYC